MVGDITTLSVLPGAVSLVVPMTAAGVDSLLPLVALGGQLHPGAPGSASRSPCGMNK